MALSGVSTILQSVAPFFISALPDEVEEVEAILGLSDSDEISGVVGVFLGIGLLILARGLYLRGTRAWRFSLTLLTGLLLLRFISGASAEEYLQVVVMLVLLVVFRKNFGEAPANRFGFPQIAALSALGTALLYGIIGSYLLREQFQGIENWIDSVYFTFITYTTLGYGDILPLTSDAKLFTVSMVIIGVTSFLTAISVAMGPVIESRVRGVLHIVGRFNRFKDHVLVCGYSRVAQAVIDRLNEEGVTCVLVDEREALLAELEANGMHVVKGDATHTATLEHANFSEARAVLATSDSDAINTLIALTAHAARQRSEYTFKIIVRVDEPENIGKARAAGADEVIALAALAGDLLASKALKRH